MIDDILFGKTRAGVLREIYLNPDRRTSFNELVRRLKSGVGAVARELKILLDTGVIVEEREGNQRFVRAGKQSPLFLELKNLIARASGAPSILREALQGLEDRIEVAFIFGSVAKGMERADSDLDLFVIGSVGYSVITERVYAVEDRLGRKVQTLYLGVNSAMDRDSLRNRSMQAMLLGPKLFVLGDESRLQRFLSTAGEALGKHNEPRQSDPGVTTRATRGRPRLEHAHRAR